jgi:peptide deformylase
VAIFRGKDGRRRAIVRMGHPVLRQRAAEVPPERFGTRALRDLERDLIRTMFDDSGVGLAAPQIAVPLRVLAYYLPGDDDHDELPPRVLVNPVLTPIGPADEPGWEGCLSIPGLRGLVPRHRALAATARTVDGDEVRFEAEGFHARVLQHEVDHLDGILFIDRMASLATLAFEDEFERYMAGAEDAIEV